MTDNEIKKALECCIKNDCVNCPYESKVHFKNCLEGFLDLINRQKAELDDLKRDDLPRCKDALRRANEIGMDVDKENQELREEIERLQKELKITRAYIHDNGLEWDLLSYSKRNGG